MRWSGAGVASTGVDMTKGTAAGALEGWRVLEVGDGLAASFCAKVLGDLGADVVTVEPPGGHRSRRRGPRRPDAAPDEPGGRFSYLNTGKSSVVVADGPDGARRLDALASECDVVVTDRAEHLALGDHDEATIVVAITPFGLTGPYARYRSHHLVAFHAGGEGSILPSGAGWKLFPERAPIQIGSDIAEYDAGWNAAVAVLGACYDRLRTRRGQRIDVSIQESELTLNRTRLSRFTNDGITLHREGNRYGFFGMIECRDGWVQLVGLTADQWDALAASPDASDLADPRVATAPRAERRHGRCRRRTARVVQGPRKGRGRAHPHAARLSHRRLRHAVRSAVVVPARAPRLLPRHRRRPRRLPAAYPARRTGSRRRPLTCARRLPSARRPGTARRRASHATVAPGRGLDGVCVLDFTWAAAGPYATCLLALLGAEVVKVESTRRPDPARRGFLADYGGIDRSPNFNEINLGKRSFQVDLSQADGLDLAHRLVDWADVVVDNFRPGVMARFGLDAASLLERRPDLLVVSSSANGSTGPDALAAGLASIFGATGGLSEQTGYVDGPPTEIGESTDYRSANAMAVAILAGLLHRARTGQGQHIDVASREVVAASSPDALLAHELGVDWNVRIGNAHREMFPHDVYKAAGDDDWVAVAVDDEEWAALCRVLDRNDWVHAYPTADARRAAGDVINGAITAWTSQRSSREAFETLQAAGVPAMAVMTNEMLANDPHVAARGVFVDIDHPEIGRTASCAAPWLFSELDCAVRHGPLIGQDNDYVLETLLRLSPEERARRSEVLR